MGRNPENLERPNPTELPPKKAVSPETIKALGRTAIKGSQQK